PVRRQPLAIELDALLLGIARVEVSFNPERTRIAEARAGYTLLDVVPFHQEARQVEQQPVVQPLALDADFVIAEIVGTVGCRYQPGIDRTLSILAAEPEPLAIKGIDHHVRIEVVFGRKLEG